VGGVDLSISYGLSGVGGQIWGYGGWLSLARGFYILLVLACICSWVAKRPPFIMIREELDLLPLYLVLVVLMPWNGPVGEEFGWRGHALPKLQHKYGPLIASLVIGTVWGIWHLPSFFAPLGVIGVLTATLGMSFLIPYTLGTIANTVFMTWLYNKSKASALIAGIVWHGAIDFWAPILLSDSSLVAAREGTHLPTVAPNLYLTVLAIQVVVAFVLVIVTKGKLGYSEIT